MDNTDYYINALSEQYSSDPESSLDTSMFQTHKTKPFDPYSSQINPRQIVTENTNHSSFSHHYRESSNIKQNQNLIDLNSTRKPINLSDNNAFLKFVDNSTSYSDSRNQNSRFEIEGRRNLTKELEKNSSLLDPQSSDHSLNDLDLESDFKKENNGHTNQSLENLELENSAVDFINFDFSKGLKTDLFSRNNKNYNNNTRNIYKEPEFSIISNNKINNNSNSFSKSAFQNSLNENALKSKSLYDLYKSNGVFSKPNNFFSKPLKPTPSSGWVYRWATIPTSRRIVGSKEEYFPKDLPLPIEVFLLPSSQSLDFSKKSTSHSVTNSNIQPTLTSRGKSLLMSNQIMLSKYDKRIVL
ncbi:hypothetical protein BB560_000544 [Smittium megazygosporum]|uniref:Uncharacterized protein n=1 Tax=Smittium megazygosporum TaxID=133381 RepID=A0A2T9ZK14_9FUNG|nr:hypothetical protein BB560_000544 [Smittium megazygosporum]